MSETVRSRFQKVMTGEMPEDRLPLIEWASWWNLTIERWQGRGIIAWEGGNGRSYVQEKAATASPPVRYVKEYLHS